MTKARIAVILNRINAQRSGGVKSQKPNIILFTTDQHRGDFIGLAENSIVETPNLDSFINQGAYFPKAYTEIPSTTGARRVLLRGQGSYTCGLVGYEGSEWDEKNSLAYCLARAGYHCINVGWRNLHPRRKLYGFHTVVPHDLREGKDDYLQWLQNEIGPYAHERSGGVDSNGWLAKPWELDERLHSTNWTVAETLNQIRRRDPTRPFFVWCSHLRPHSPYDPPKFFWDMYMAKDLPQPVVGEWADKHAVPQPGISRTAWAGRLTTEQNRRMLAGYMGCITHIDYQLGHLMELLQRDRLWSNTLVLFTADHGDMMGDHHLHRKCYAYEGSARIPFVIRYPEGLELTTGAFPQVVGLQDVMPTLLEAAGVDIPQEVTGRSVLGAIRGEKWREFFHGEHSPCYALEHGMHYLTDGKRKYIWYAVTGEEQLFNLEKDPRELHDLSQEENGRKETATWRRRLVRLLELRKDGFSDGTRLIPKKEWYGPAVHH